MPEGRRWEASAPGCSGWWSRARERRRSAGCCSSPRSGSVSTLATGFRSLVAVGSAPARRTRCSARSPLSRRRAGGSALAAVARPGRHRLGGDRPNGIAVAIETKTRTYDSASSLGCATRRRGCRGAGEGGPATVRLGVMCVVRARGVERVERRRARGFDRPVDACPVALAAAGSTLARAATPLGCRRHEDEFAPGTLRFCDEAVDAQPPLGRQHPRQS